MSCKEWTLADVAIEPARDKDGVTVRHLATNRAVYVDNIAIGTEFLRGAKVIAGSIEERRNVIAVRIAWRQSCDESA
jgi:hypothetical protein